MKKRVGVLRGGAGEYYEKSLQEGGEIILHIHKNLSENWQIVDILVDQEGIWHADGVPLVPADLIHKVDVVWNTAHHSFSQTLASLGIPHFGIDPFSFVLDKNQKILEEHTRRNGFNMPRSLILPVYQEDFDGPREKYSIKKAKEVHEKFSPPWIIKSFTRDRGMAIHLAKTFLELVNAIEDGVNHGKSILVEEFILGKDAEVHLLSGFRGQEVYTFPFLFSNTVLNNLSAGEKEKIKSLAHEIFKHVGAMHYLRSDFKINKKGKIFFTNIETMPSFQKNSPLSFACESVGAKMHHIIEHILEKTLNGT